MRKVLSVILSAAMIMSLAACGGSKPAETTAAPAAAPAAAETTAAAPAAGGGTEAPKVDESKMSPVQKVIKEAQGMTLEELAKKAIEESNGKMFYGVGNSSRGKSALPLFIDYLKTIDPSYNMDFEWQQPKNNKIF
ncbi:MAG: hypothetical protein IJT43_05360, partial [Stomatobaculum sp.]|nr:hypothetical protein [Stomatobaculum sp.]